MSYPSHRDYYSVSNLKVKSLLGQLGNQIALSTETRVLAEKICKFKKEERTGGDNIILLRHFEEHY